tara:strand:+ start:28 stop:381 length:354 start_codon:yes stop_codon:yes gene_type:complete
MSKLSQQEEKELISFFKDWLKSHGFTQKDLANELNIKSDRTTEIIIKLKEFYKKGGMFNIAKNLIKIEQNWLNNIKTDSQESNDHAPYNQLVFGDIYTDAGYDIESLNLKMNKDTSE